MMTFDSTGGAAALHSNCAAAVADKQEPCQSLSSPSLVILYFYVEFSQFLFSLHFR